MIGWSFPAATASATFSTGCWPAAAICDGWADIKLAAIGPGTAAELARYHLRADLMPDEYRAESLAEALLEAGARRAIASSWSGRIAADKSCPSD